MAKDFDILNIPMSLPKRRMNDYSYCLYGHKKFGKSKFASMFPNSLFFGFEKGQNAIKGKILPVSTWKQFKDFVKALVDAKDKGKVIPYKTFIIDTDDFATKYCTEYVCKQNGWSDPSEGDWGAGWRAVADEYWREIDRLEKLGTADDPTMVIHIMHDTDKEFKPRGKEKFNKIVPNISGKISQYILDPIDFIIYCTIDIEKDQDGNTREIRRMKIRGTTEYEAGSRLRYMPEFIDYGFDEKEAYAKFCEVFKSAVIQEFGEEDGDDSGEPTQETTNTILPNDDKPEDKPNRRRRREEKTTDEVPPTNEPPKNDTAITDDGVQDSPSDNNSNDFMNRPLDVIKKDLNRMFMKLYNSGAKNPVELVELVESNTGNKKISLIDTKEKAEKLYKALSEN
jgi:hypothetical protein